MAVSALPAVEMSWPIHSRVNERLRKMEKVEAGGRALKAVIKCFLIERSLAPCGLNCLKP
jgi:hypothetical protein